MRSLFQNEVPDSRRVGRMAGISIGAHAIAFALVVVGTFHARRTIVLRPMKQGSATAVSVAAINHGVLAAALAMKTPVTENQPTHPHLVPKPHPILPEKPSTAPPAPTAPPSPHAPAAQEVTEKSAAGDTGSGSDAQNMYPAYPTVSPSPQVRDRSLLPPTDQRVIVDVNLGTDGQVQQARLVSGLGNGLDQLVLDTVRGWQFHPAMVNGSPVASSIELVFPFNRAYPIAD